MSKMPLISETFDITAVTAYIPKDLPTGDDVWTISSSELIGIEVEVENVGNVAGLNPCWTAAEDGSLRNNGREFITHPIPAYYAIGALLNLFEGKYAKNFCFSPRTSVHVHLNCQDLSTQQVVDILLLYGLYERLLYRFVGKSRWKNIYCTPVTETDFYSNLGYYGVKAPWEKYTGLNILPLSQHGTIEFRHMHGTTDVRKLSIWIDLITKFKEYVKTHSTDSIRKTIINFTADQISKLAADIWGNPLAQFLEMSDPEEVMSRLPVVKTGLYRPMVTNEQVEINPTAKYFTI